MSTYGTALVEGGNLTAGADLSSSQFLAVKASTSTARQVVLANTGGEAITGLLQNTPKSGEAVEVAHVGFAKAKAGTGGWTAGQQLQTDTSGQLIGHSSGTVVAIAHEVVAAGQIGLVRVVPTAG